MGKWGKFGINYKDGFVGKDVEETEEAEADGVDHQL